MTLVAPPNLLPRRLLRHRLVRLGGLAAAVVMSIAIDAGALFVVPVLFALVVPFEKLFPRHPSQKVRRAALGTDIGYALASPVLGAVGIGAAIVIGIVSLAWVPGLALRPAVSIIPDPVLPLVGLALFDVSIYWAHRWAHEVPFLWRFHAIHHSGETMDWISGLRNHPLDGALIAPPFVLLLAAGFSVELSGALTAIQLVLGLFLHANVRWRLRPLHRIVVTPEFHHWHHANEPQAIHTNYSVFLPVWDIVFGTYYMPEDRRPIRYGVDEPIPAGIIAQLHHPLRGAGNPLQIVRHPIATARTGARYVPRLLCDLAAASRSR